MIDYIALLNIGFSSVVIVYNRNILNYGLILDLLLFIIFFLEINNKLTYKNTNNYYSNNNNNNNFRYLTICRFCEKYPGKILLLASLNCNVIFLHVWT